MKVWLYLAKHEFARAWIEGGDVPLNVVSTYRRAERSDIYTPDEVQQTDYNLEIAGLIDMTGNFSFKNCTVIGGPGNASGILNGRHWEEDGLVLSMTYKAPNLDVMKCFKKQCCVRIEDVGALTETLDRQVGAVSEMRACEYTQSRAKLNHFRKGMQDAWQAEYRMFWKDQPQQSVTLLSGTATAVPLHKLIWHSGTFFQ